MRSVAALENVGGFLRRPHYQPVRIHQYSQNHRYKGASGHAVRSGPEPASGAALKGNGEVADGFLSSASPYFDWYPGACFYDPEKAKSLLAQSGWDQSKSIRFCIDSGDSTFVNAASVIAAQWAAVGIKADIQTMDINTLMSTASSSDF